MDHLLDIAIAEHSIASERQRTNNVILKDLTLQAGGGEFISIVGPSGCGKSTLLTMVAGLNRPTNGTIRFAGSQVTGVNRDVGFIFQRDALLPWRTILQNVELALKFRKVDKAERRSVARHWLSRFGLGAMEDRYPREMSGGQRKRASIAASLVYEPKLLLMDEPFSALDAQTRDQIETDILNAWSTIDGQTVIFVTHDLEEAIALSDRVLVMASSPGTIVSDYRVDLPRPRDLMEIRTSTHFRELYTNIWSDLRAEVLKAQSNTDAP